MCYSKESSMHSMIIHVICTFILVMWGIKYKRNDMVCVGVILFGIGTMQLAEYYMHDDLTCSNGKNRIGSVLGYYSLIIIQPIFGMIAIQLANVKANAKKKLCLIWAALLLINIISTIPTFPKDKDLCTNKKICDHKPYCTLYWDWNPWGKANAFTPIQWIIYCTLVFGLPLIALNQGGFLLVLFAAQIIFEYAIPLAWTPAGSCYWGPLLVYALYLLDIPNKIPTPRFLKLV